MDLDKDMTQQSVKTQLFATYHNEGHYMYPEDTWTESRQIDCKEDLVQMFIDCYRHDAGTHNNYPFNGHISPSSTTFYVQEYVVVNDKKFWNKEQIHLIEGPDYFQDAIEEFELFLTRMKRTIPKLRKAKSIKDREEKERKQYERLKEKFENS